MGSRGFTLIEAAITTFILVTAFSCLANAFTYSAFQTSRLGAGTVASALAAEKIESLRSASALAPGRFSEHLPFAVNGSVSRFRSTEYLQTWQISTGNPTHITVVVYGRLTPRDIFHELARYTTEVGAGF